MRAMMALFRSFVRDRRGATAVEYSIILALIFIAMLVGLRGLGTAHANVWATIVSKMPVL